jgi:hypothetical protein
MALFEYFPNYIWNLSVAIAMESGGRIGEIIDMCQPIRDAAANGADAGTPQFMAQWVSMGERLIGLADEDAARGHNFAASDKLERAALYLLVAERMQAQGSPGRTATYARALASFERSTVLGKLNRERVEIPLQSGTMPAIYTRGSGTGLLQWSRQLQRAAVLDATARCFGTSWCVNAVCRSTRQRRSAAPAKPACRPAQ